MRSLFLLTALLWPFLAFAGESGDLAVVLYNSKMAASKKVALHYAAARHVPASQVLGFELAETETMTRLEYAEQLEKPLLERLQALGLLLFDTLHGSNGLPGKFLSAKIRYAVVCYGVPTRILDDPTLIETNIPEMNPNFRRNDKAVDAELTLLPGAGKYRVTGPLPNPFYGATNEDRLHPGNGVLLVGRLDGPSAAIAMGLVDKATQAERDGLWGRAYFDLRGLTNGNYKLGDDWIGAAAQVTRRNGFDTIIDNEPATFPASFPMSQIALYAGWYEAQASGPFTLPRVEFMPGAFAYHLFSFSAQPLRETSPSNRPWCATLLAEGATATMGCVNEPYLETTPNVGIFFARWLRGFSLGEAGLVCQPALSWQTTVLGDPLYRPFGKVPKEQEEDLLARKSDLAAWALERYVNVGLEFGITLPDSIHYLEQQPMTERNAVLSEKLGDLYLQANEGLKAFYAYKRALKLKPTPRQEVRLTNAVETARLRSVR